VVTELTAKLAEWRKSTNDVAPKRRTPDEFDRETGAATESQASSTEQGRDGEAIVAFVARVSTRSNC